MTEPAWCSKGLAIDTVHKYEKERRGYIDMRLNHLNLRTNLIVVESYRPANMRKVVWLQWEKYESMNLLIGATLSNLDVEVRNL